MKSLLKLLALATTAFYTTACAAIPKNEVVTQATFPADPEQVWQVLTDGDSFTDWNPFIVDMQGTIKKGEKLRNVMEPTPGKRAVFKPTILVAKPNQELRWLGRVVMPGIFDGEHYFLLEAYQGSTLLTHGEKFSGIALLFMDTDKFHENFEAMNEALLNRLIELNYVH